MKTVSGESFEKKRRSVDSRSKQKVAGAGRRAKWRAKAGEMGPETQDIEDRVQGEME
jgi:hypothetical protein